ncbi:MAG: hypothetical protein ABJE66_10600 [Deltaproteobacteria bacterium]
MNLAIEWFRDKSVWPARELEPQQLVITQHSLSWPMTIDAIVPERPTYDPYWSSPSVGYRPGRLIAYIDGNHDDELDFTPIDANDFTDRIIAYASGTTINYYTTVDVFAQNVQVPNVGPTDMPIDQPLELLQRTDLAESCNLLADWEPYTAYESVFGGIPLDANQRGPWDFEAASDSPCPGNVAPAQTAEVSCDAGASQWHAQEVAQTSTFIAQTCGKVMRVCEGGDSTPSPCPCDATRYYCTQYEGGL